MTEPGQPRATIEHQPKQFDQPRPQDARKPIMLRLTTSVVLVVVFLVTASIVVFMREEHHLAADRARVIVEEATIIGPLIQHNVPRATILLKNIGLSPVLKAKSRLVMTVWTSKMFPDWEMPLRLTSDTENIGEIDPGSTTLRTISLLAPLTDVQGMHLERKDWFIVILGVVAYTDGTGTPHETNLCLIWSDTSRDRLTLCEKWNDAT